MLIAPQNISTFAKYSIKLKFCIIKNLTLQARIKSGAAVVEKECAAVFGLSKGSFLIT